MKQKLSACIAALLMLHSAAHAAPPANDFFANATAIAGNSGVQTGDTTQASVEVNEPDNGDGHSVWFTWTAPYTGTAQFDTIGTAFDSFLAVYTGTAIVALTEVVSDDNGGGGVTSLVNFAVSNGATYRIRVSGIGTDAGSYTLNWSKIPTPGSFTFSGPAHFGEGAGAATYTVTRTDGFDGPVTLHYFTSDNTAKAPGDYLATSGMLSFADGDLAKSFTVTVNPDMIVEGEESFFVKIDMQSAGTIANATVETTIIDSDHPANDSFATAAALTGASGTTSGTTINATIQNGEPQNGVESVWFDWTAPGTTTAIFDTDTSAFPTVLSVYTGATLQSLVLVGTSSENPLTLSGQGRLVFAATAGVHYKIQVARNPKQVGAPGNVTLTWSTTPNGGFEITLDSQRVFEDVDANVVLTLRRIGGTDLQVAVDYQVANDTATIPADYGGTATGTITFAPGDVMKTLTIPIFNDTFSEGLEDFIVTLTGVTGGTAVFGNRITSTIFIVDDDDDPAFDDFTKAQTLVGTNVSADFDSTGADVDRGEPDLTGTGDGVVWLKWIAPATGLARLSIADVNGYTPVLKSFTGTTLADLVGGPAQSDVTGFLDLQVVGGNTYYFAVAGQGSGDGQGLFHLDLNFAAGGTISAQDFSVGEADGSATIHFHRTSPLGSAHGKVTITGGTATVGLDYGFAARGVDTVVFAPGETDKTLTFPIANDTIVEGDEDIQFSVQTSGEVIAETFPLVVTIIDDDDDPANDAFASAQGLSGTSGKATGTLTGAGRESGEPGGGLTVSKSVWYRWTAPSTGVATFAVTLDTAVTNINVYTGAALASLTPVASALGDAPVSFAVTAGTIYQIQFTDDTTVGPGDFTFVWSIDGNGSVFSVVDTSVNENAGTVLVTVTRTGALSSAGTVQYATADDTAFAGVGLDYTATSGTLNFAATDTSKTFSVTINNDTEVEGNEAFSVNLSSPSPGAILGVDHASVTIFDDDDDPVNNNFASPTTIAGLSGTQLSTNVGADPEVGEPKHGGAGGTSVWFSWTAPANGEVTFDTEGSSFDTLLAAYTGTALNALNQLARNNDVDASNGDVTSRISFLVTSGTVYRIAVDGSFGDTGDIQLHWIVRVPGTFQFAAANVTHAEVTGTATITVTRVAGSNGPATVDYATADGTATAGLDYVATSGTLSFADGDTSKTFTVKILPDAIFEQDETVLLTLSNPSNNAGLGLAAATLTITDNDVFIPLKTGYTGLVTPSAFDNSLTGGLSLKADGKGGFSGSLVLGGEKLGFKGSFDAKGFAMVTLTRKGGAQATLKLQITAGGDQIVGTLVSGPNTASVSADRNVFGSDVPTTQFADNFTLLITGNRAAVGEVPRGDGAATVSIGSNGLAKIVGALADGTKISLGVPVSKAGLIPLYVALYKNAGSLSGALQIRAHPGVSDGDGLVDWFKPAGKDKVFPGGFTITQTPALLSRHHFVPGERILAQLDATNGAAQFTAGLGNLAVAIKQVINVSEANVVSLPLTPTIPLVLKVVGSTGYFSGTFQAGGGKPTPFQGVAFRAQGLCSGFFLGSSAGVTESGFVEIAPAN